MSEHQTTLPNNSPQNSNSKTDSTPAETHTKPHNSIGQVMVRNSPNASASRSDSSTEGIKPNLDKGYLARPVICSLD